ncbi:TPA: ATP-binding protein [Vibrio parahaemolyticus]|uniref:ATP-binding protein n=1 Tax=Vibrio parahaemolyticus TaxID=670 RepID=UPI000420925D|nr:ATP-binding protein [Vibrio parahaemolyticus]HCE2224693.1 ATP-binding protein [Vibrio parahaemolyticus]
MSTYPTRYEKSRGVELPVRHDQTPINSTVISKDILNTAHELINKSYLAELKSYSVIAADSKGSIQLNPSSDVRIFQVERLVQENKQSILESLTAAYTALGAAGYSVFVFLKSDGKQTQFYLGTRGEPGKMLGQNSGALLQESFKGHFPGSKLTPLKGEAVDTLLDDIGGMPSSSTVTAVSSVPSLSTADQEHFMQGLERFIDAAESRVYEGLILAEPVSMQALNGVRSGYEQVATQLSSLAKRQYSYGLQDSAAVSQSISEGLSRSLGESLGKTETYGTSEGASESNSQTYGTNQSTSSPDLASRALAVGTMALGAIAAPFTAGASYMIAGAVSGALTKTNTQGTSESTTTGTTTTQSSNYSNAKSQTTTQTDTNSTTNTSGTTYTQGNSQQVSYEVTDKGILAMLDKIDHQLKRVDEAKSHGGWLSTAYFISDSPASSEALASIFLGLTRGSHSATEDFALTTWSGNKSKEVTNWLSQLMHPRLKPPFGSSANIDYLTPATLVSSKEMAIQLSLPRRSTSTVVVQEAAAFGRQVQSLSGCPESNNRTIELGRVRHLWTDLPQTINLDVDNLSSHVFVTGSTGSGKSNTIYELLSELQKHQIPFLVIEPAKGEYKHVFGNQANVRVLGTNSTQAELLAINPFSFPAETHVLEHVDRLIEVFNVCWPMYAAMPAILKDALLRSYEQCGWDLNSSQSDQTPNLFPNFADLLIQLEQVIEQSAYSAEMKGNYIGALVTRVRSMVNGLNGQIFTANELSNEALFDNNVIIDLSRVGSAETKSLIMGLLVIKLSEYRAEQALMNQPLRHVTVLEEAHNILRASHSNGGVEGGGMAEKSVEMISNAIAEMRTYGQGFVIADQSPSAVHISAIRNTNTKIIMRLPDETDRFLAGKSAALNDDQLDELARLPCGVAVVYQNEWLEAVLCKVNRFFCQTSAYHYQFRPEESWNEKEFRFKLINYLLSNYNQLPIDTSDEQLIEGLFLSCLPTQFKIRLSRFMQTGLTVHLYSEFAAMLPQMLECEQQLVTVVRDVKNIEEVHFRFELLILNNNSYVTQQQVLMIIQTLFRALINKDEQYKQLYYQWKKFVSKETA